MARRKLRLTVLVALLPLGLAASCSGDADFVILNGRVLTPDSSAAPADVVSIHGDRIAALTRWHTFNTLDVGGGVVMPAFVDHHIHLLNVGLWLLNDRDDGRLFLDVSRVTSLDELAAVIRERVASLPAGTWITGAGWSQGAWGSQALPDASVLDAAAPDHPVFLARTDAHAGWVNRAALAAAGITDATSDPHGGRIVRGASGRPTGILLERANELVTPLLPRLTDEDIVSAFRLAADALAAPRRNRSPCA